MIFELIASCGLQWILRYGSILEVPRCFIKRIPFFRKLLDCSLCTGFHTGWIIALYCWFFVVPNPLYFIFPFASAGVCWFFDSLLDLIQEILVILGD
jgi:hypothetical protein